MTQESGPEILGAAEVRAGILALVSMKDRGALDATKPGDLERIGTQVELLKGHIIDLHEAGDPSAEELAELLRQNFKFVRGTADFILE